MQNHYKDSLYTFNRFFIMQIVIMVNYLSKQMFSLLHVLELQLLLQQIHYGLWRLGYKYCIVKLFSVSISICGIYLQRKCMSLLKILCFAFDYWHPTLLQKIVKCHWNDCQVVKYHTMCHWHVPPSPVNLWLLDAFSNLNLCVIALR